MRSGYVYIVQALGQGPIAGWVKIGWAKDIARRMVEIAATSGSDVTLLGSFRGTQADEGLLMKRFAGDLIARDWFTPSTELLAFAREHAALIQISLVHSCTAHTGHLLSRLATSNPRRRGPFYASIPAAYTDRPRARAMSS